MRGAYRSQRARPPDTQRRSLKQWTRFFTVLVLIWAAGAGIRHFFVDTSGSTPSSEVLASAVTDSSAAAPSVPDGAVPAAVAATARQEGPVGTAPRPLSTFFKSNDAGPGGYSIQVAAVPDVQEALALLEGLNRVGYPGYITTTTVNHIQLYRVRVGPFRRRDTARQSLQHLERLGHDNPWIVR